MAQLLNPHKKIVNSPMWEPKIKKKGKQGGRDDAQGITAASWIWQPC